MKIEIKLKKYEVLRLKKNINNIEWTIASIMNLNDEPYIIEVEQVSERCNIVSILTADKLFSTYTCDSYTTGTISEEDK